MEGLNLKINGKEIKIKEDKIKLLDLAKEFSSDFQGYICGAIINNRQYDLNHIVYKDEEIEFFDTTSQEGNRLYYRSLSFLLVLACRDVVPNCKVFIEHSISGGLYCGLKTNVEITEELVYKIKERMIKYVKEDHKIAFNYMPTDEAIEMFEKFKRFDKVELLKYREDDLTKVYECNGYFDYFYGYMFPSTSYIKDFDLFKLGDGVVIMGPKSGKKGQCSKFKKMNKLTDIYREAESWSKTLGIDTVVDLNKKIEKNEYSEMIRTVEALHEKKIAEIADLIVKNKKQVILISAPSSSGKTSFAHRLSIQLRVNGLEPLAISLDDYFVDRDKTPKDENGEYDFESIYAIDIEKFNKDLNDLINGKSIDKIKFDFIEGSRKVLDEKISLKKNQPIILEGIHGLNPTLTKDIEDKLKFKIYISVITGVNLDDHNRIPTTDLRLIRRMVRDYSTRGNNAEATLEKWPSVRRGEEKNIFPFQEQADIMFNSASVYELSVLKSKAIKILKEVDENSKYSLEAKRLKKFLQYFKEINDIADIGPTSIIREFIGGSRIV